MIQVLVQVNDETDRGQDVKAFYPFLHYSYQIKPFYL